MGKNYTAETLFAAGMVALESISPGKDTMVHHTLASKENFPRQRPALWILRNFSRGVTRTSCYCFEYDLHLIKIPPHFKFASLRLCTFKGGIINFTMCLSLPVVRCVARRRWGRGWSLRGTSGGRGTVWRGSQSGRAAAPVIYRLLHSAALQWLQYDVKLFIKLSD